MGPVLVISLTLSTKPNANRSSQNMNPSCFTVQVHHARWCSGSSAVSKKTLKQKTMLRQPSLYSQEVSLSSKISYFHQLQWESPNFTLHQLANYKKLPKITCSISQIHSYGTGDYQRRPMIKWNVIYSRISRMQNPELGAGSVLNQWENEGERLTKWELFRVVKKLRKSKRYQQALEVYDWMNNRQERFALSSSDAAIQLDLIAKVHGVSGAEDFFQRLPSTLKDRRTYGALLNAYVRNRMREKAESLFDEMRDKGYAIHALAFNVMMTLYMNLKEYDKVDLVISEMNEKNIKLDIYSYNNWLVSCGSQGFAQKMEYVIEQMKLDRSINPDWTTFSTMANMYTIMGQLEKAEDCLRRVESRITGRDRKPYHYLLNLYGSVGNKEEVYRVWNIYKSIFPSIPNMAYHAIISSLVRMDDIEEAEKIYKEWLSIKSTYEPRIANIFMAAYVNQGNLEKAGSFLNHMLEAGGKPNPNSWKILAQGHILERRIPEALSCLKEAFSAPGSKFWKPNPANVSSFFKLCEEEADMASKVALESFLKQLGYHEDKAYGPLLGMSVTGDEPSTKIDGTEDNKIGIEDGDGSEMLFNQSQESP